MLPTGRVDDLRILTKWVTPVVAATILSFIAGYLLGTATGIPRTIRPIVPGIPVAVTVAVHAGLARHELVVSRGRIDNPSTVALLTRDLNDLPTLKQRTLLCPNDNGSFDVLRFRYHDGDRWSVVVKRSGCLLVYARADAGNTRSGSTSVFTFIDRLTHSANQEAPAE